MQAYASPYTVGWRDTVKAHRVARAAGTPHPVITSLSRDFRPCCSCRMVLAVTSLESRGFGEEHDVLNSISTWVALIALCHHAPHILVPSSLQ